jgi:hypothetical protein
LTPGAALPPAVKTGKDESTGTLLHSHDIIEQGDGTTYIQKGGKDAAYSGSLVVPSGHPVLLAYLRQLDVWWADLEGVASSYAQKLKSGA